MRSIVFSLASYAYPCCIAASCILPSWPLRDNPLAMSLGDSARLSRDRQSPYWRGLKALALRFRPIAEDKVRYHADTVSRIEGSAHVIFRFCEIFAGSADRLRFSSLQPAAALAHSRRHPADGQSSAHQHRRRSYRVIPDWAQIPGRVWGGYQWRGHRPRRQVRLGHRSLLAGTAPGASAPKPIQFTSSMSPQRDPAVSAAACSSGPTAST